MALFDQPLAEMGAKKARAAGDQNPLIEVVSTEQIYWLQDEKVNSFLIIAEIKEGENK